MIAARPDLLIIGGLAIDRLADGSTVAGGTVVHAARAIAWSGSSVATITVAGPEPQAAVVVTELAALGSCRASPVEGSIRFAISEGDGGRRLVFEGGGGELTVAAAEVAGIDPRAVLIAPIATELGAEAVRSCRSVPVRVAALQGWLRGLTAGEVVQALPIDALGDDLAAALGAVDAVVASDEDLAAVANEPGGQIEMLRQRVGPHPSLVITAGDAGAWLDDPASGRCLLTVPRRLDGISTVGAGDAFAAFLAVGLGDGLAPLAAAQAAITATADFLSTQAR